MERIICNDVILYKDERVWGDGEHPSTVGCLELLKRINLNGKKVLDIGTGTGIQAIFAKTLGAEEVFAVDINPAAIGLGEYNAQINNVAIEFKLILNSDDFSYKADAIVANLPPHILIEYLPKLRRHMNKGCVVITSMPDEFNMIAELNNAKCGLVIADRYVDDQYCAFLLEERK